MMEMKMKEQMEKWTEKQQAEWKNVMEDKVNEEKSIRNEQNGKMWWKIKLTKKSRLNS